MVVVVGRLAMIMRWSRKWGLTDGWGIEGWCKSGREEGMI